MSNPLREPGAEPFAAWLRDLSDLEAIALLEAVSADMKRRNSLLGAPSPDQVMDMLNTFMSGSGRSQP